MSSVKEGEEIELSAQVKDIADGNMVTFQVWKDGQDPAGASIPYAQLPVTVEGGAATTTWRCIYGGIKIPPKEDPKFFFTAHSAWCAMKKSSNATIELVRPELSEAKWGATTGLVGEELTLSVSAAEFDEGKGVTFNIFVEGADTESEQPVRAIGADIEGGTAEAVWMYNYNHDPANPLTEKPKFIFTVSADKAETIESGSVEISAKIKVTIVDRHKKPRPDVEYILHQSGGESVEGKTDSEGVIEKEDLVPGSYRIEIKEKEEK